MGLRMPDLGLSRQAPLLQNRDAPRTTRLAQSTVAHGSASSEGMGNRLAVAVLSHVGGLPAKAGQQQPCGVANPDPRQDEADGRTRNPDVRAYPVRCPTVI